MRVILPPKMYGEIEVRYSRRHAVQWLRQAGVLDLTRKVANHFDYTVQGGPFRGMRYTRAAVLTHHSTPNLLGTYERQLYPFLAEAAIRCDAVVDIGSAEGYFAVGLARLTGKPVAAFDVNAQERRMVREMAELNHVSRLMTVSNWCSPATLMDLVRGKHALVFCDIDGGEFSLFTPEVVEALRGCDVFIELHGSAQENLAFIRRFSDREPIVLDHPPAPASTELLTFLGADATRMATEYRDPQQWLVLRPADVSSLERLGQKVGQPAVKVTPSPAPAEVSQAAD